MIQKIVYPLPPTLNKIINSARKSIYKSSSEKRKWTQDIAMLSHCLCSYGKAKVWLKFEWQIYNQNCDPDNISAAAKFIMDGLVMAGIIADYSLMYIGSPILHYYSKTEKWQDSCVLTLATTPPIVNFLTAGNNSQPNS